MRAALLISVSVATVLAACERGSGPLPAHDEARGGTRAMGAASGPASARAPAAPPQEDVDAGRTIAAQGAPGAAACVSCHGANAEGNAQAGFPRLAGLGRVYIEHQLNSYADGTRAHPVMTSIAGALSAQQRAQVAAYLAGLGVAAPANGSTNPADAPVLVARGDAPRAIPACANCHGPQSIGDPAATPYLAGQNEPYLASALAAWKSGSRHNDPSGQMPAIAKALTDAEARTLAAYYAALPPPARHAQAGTPSGSGAAANPQALDKK